MKQKILIVDDEMAWCDLIKEAIETADLGECDTVCNAQKAISMIKSNLENSKPYLTVLVDNFLDEYNGMTLIQKIRQIEKQSAVSRNLKIIVVSAYNLDYVNCVKIGADDCLHKPFSIKELREKVNDQ